MSLFDGLVDNWESYTSGSNWVGETSRTVLTRTGTVPSAVGHIGKSVPGFTGVAGRYLSSTGLTFGGTYMIAAWVWLNSLSGDQAIAVKDDVGSHREFTMTYNNAGGGFNLATMGGGFDSITALYATTSAWAFVVGWRDAVNSQVGIRINNGTKNTTPLTTTQTAGSAPLAIGDRPASAMAMNGRIGPLFIWSRVLSDAEQTTLWNGGAGLNLGGSQPHNQSDAVCGILPRSAICA